MFENGNHISEGCPTYKTKNPSDLPSRREILENENIKEKSVAFFVIHEPPRVRQCR